MHSKSGRIDTKNNNFEVSEVLDERNHNNAAMGSLTLKSQITLTKDQRPIPNNLLSGNL